MLWTMESFIGASDFILTLSTYWYSVLTIDGSVRGCENVVVLVFRIFELVYGTLLAASIWYISFCTELAATRTGV